MVVAWLAWLLAGGRIVIGLAPIVAARATSRLLGFPEAHDNATTRLMARMFGVRDIGLGVLVIAGMRHPKLLLPPILLFNLAIDLADAAMIVLPLREDGPMRRAARNSLAFALGGAALWFVTWWIARH